MYPAGFGQPALPPQQLPPQLLPPQQLPPQQLPPQLLPPQQLPPQLLPPQQLPPQQLPPQLLPPQQLPPQQLPPQLLPPQQLPPQLLPPQLLHPQQLPFPPQQLFLPNQPPPNADARMGWDHIMEMVEARLMPKPRCPLCQNPFVGASQQQMGRVLACGHTVCFGCLRQLQPLPALPRSRGRPAAPTVRCPACGKVHTIKIEDAPVNLAALSG